MKIAVCVKQVPLASEVSFNLERKTVLRDGVELTINAYDRRALTEALRLKGELAGEVLALSMGPPQAREALVECLALGCDRAIHICDPALAGSDSLVTARVLAAALGPEAPDLIFCGKHSVDAETGQVGPQLAELLGLPQVTGATRLTLTENPRLISVERETDEGRDVLEVRLPAVLTAAERLCRPLKTDPEALEAAAERQIPVLSAADLGFAGGEVGAAGSPTLVSEIRTLQVDRRRQLFDGRQDPDGAAERLADLLDERGLLGGQALAGRQPFPPGWRPTLGGPGIWVVADLLGDLLRPSTLELLGKGAELAATLDGELAVVLIGGPRAAEHVATLARHGTARVYLAADERLAAYQVEPYVELLARLIRQREPRMLLFSATSFGRDLAPRLAARLGLGLVADCVGLEVGADGLIGWLKPAFGGLVVAPILCRTRPELATIRPGMLPRPGPPLDFTPPDLVSLATADLPAAGTRLVATHLDAGLAGVALDDAAVVVCVGQGIGGPENLPLVADLAAALGGAIGATRKVVDLGWLPRQQQVGLTGRAIAPSLYVGLGISGGFNHTIGILRAGTIVAINNDPEARIFELADVGLIAPWEQAVPALTVAVRRRRAAGARPTPTGSSPTPTRSSRLSSRIAGLRTAEDSAQRRAAAGPPAAPSRLGENGESV